MSRKSCSENSKFLNNPDYICGPKGRYIKIGGNTHLKYIKDELMPNDIDDKIINSITSRNSRNSRTSRNNSCSENSKSVDNPDYICGPKGRYIKIGGAAYKKYVKEGLIEPKKEKKKEPKKEKKKEPKKTNTTKNNRKSKSPKEPKKEQKKEQKKTNTKKKHNIKIRKFVKKTDKGYAEELLKDGVVVIPILNEKESKMYRKQFDIELNNFREYLVNEDNQFLNINGTKKYYLNNGFGAFGNPSSYHNPMVRDIRKKIMLIMIPIIKELNKLEDRPERKLEQLFDRLRIFAAGKSVAKESWHRDESNSKNLRLIGENGIKEGEQDSVFGGWINLDTDNNQYFSCVPGTYTELPKKGGFDKISDEKDIEKYNETKEKIEIPPGHLIVFYQHIVHEVFGGKKKITDEDEYRLFVGWRLTDDDERFFNLDKIIEDQGVPLFPSGGQPPMYENMNWRFKKQREILEKWSTETFKDEVLEDKVVGSGDDKGTSYRVVHRYMKSLREYGFDMYPKYKKDEKEILKPNNEWIINYKGKEYKMSLL